MLLAYRASLARHLDFMPVVVPALTDRNLTLSTIQPRTLCDCLELAEEVAFGFAILVCENLAVGHRMFLVLGQQRTQLSGERDLPFLVLFRNETNIRLALAAHHETESFQVDVFQSGVLDFLLAASGAHKEELSQILLGRHRCEKFGKLLRVVRLRPGPLNLRELD
jgi:hypothetical protein